MNYDQNFSLTGLNQNQEYILVASHSEYGNVEKEFSMSSMVHVEDIEFDFSEMSFEKDHSQSPGQFSLSQNFPNPFNPVTSLSYDLPKDSYVSIIIYDMLGNVINNLVESNQSSGYKTVRWNATNNQGQPVSAGVYLYSIEAGEFRQIKKMILLK